MSDFVPHTPTDVIIDPDVIADIVASAIQSTTNTNNQPVMIPDEVEIDWDAIFKEIGDTEFDPSAKRDTRELISGDSAKDKLDYTEPNTVAHVLSYPEKYTAGDMFAMKNTYFHNDQSGAQYARRAMHAKKQLDVLYKAGLVTDYRAAFLMIGDTNMDVCQAELNGKQCCNPSSANSFFCGKHRKGKNYDDGLTAMVVNRRRELEDGSCKNKDRRSISCKRAKYT